MLHSEAVSGGGLVEEVVDEVVDEVVNEVVEEDEVSDEDDNADDNCSAIPLESVRKLSHCF